jgi:hypothetical protein
MLDSQIRTYRSHLALGHQNSSSRCLQVCWGKPAVLPGLGLTFLGFGGNLPASDFQSRTHRPKNIPEVIDVSLCGFGSLGRANVLDVTVEHLGDGRFTCAFDELHLQFERRRRQDGFRLTNGGVDGDCEGSDREAGSDVAACGGRACRERGVDSGILRQDAGEGAGVLLVAATLRPSMSEGGVSREEQADSKATAFLKPRGGVGKRRGV